MKKLRVTVNLKVILGIAAIMISVGVIGFSVFNATSKKSQADEQSLYTYQLISYMKEIRLDIAQMTDYARDCVSTGNEDSRQLYEEAAEKTRDNLDEVIVFVGEGSEKPQVMKLAGMIQDFPSELDKVAQAESESEEEDEVDESDEELEYTESGFIEQAKEADEFVKSVIVAGEEELVLNKEEAERKEAELIWWIIFGTILCSSMAVLTAMIVMFLVTKPLVRLTEVIESISKGDLTTSIDEKILKTNDEVGDLARAFDRTMVSLKLAMKRQTGDKTDIPKKAEKSQSLIEKKK